MGEEQKPWQRKKVDNAEGLTLLFGKGRGGKGLLPDEHHGRGVKIVGQGKGGDLNGHIVLEEPSSKEGT